MPIKARLVGKSNNEIVNRWSMGIFLGFTETKNGYILANFEVQGNPCTKIMGTTTNIQINDLNNFRQELGLPIVSSTEEVFFPLTTEDLGEWPRDVEVYVERNGDYLNAKNVRSINISNGNNPDTVPF